MNKFSTSDFLKADWTASSLSCLSCLSSVLGFVIRRLIITAEALGLSIDDRY